MPDDRTDRHRDHDDAQHGSGRGMGDGMYGRLALALTISLLLMWVLTMSMIDVFDHFYFNLSNLWMAVIMVAPMGLVMLVVMHSMYPRKRLNIGLGIGFVAVFALAFWAGREEVGVGDEQFLKSMIPHHSRAILVCQEADISDAEIADLCERIIETQREEIREMEGYLEARD